MALDIYIFKTICCFAVSVLCTGSGGAKSGAVFKEKRPTVSTEDFVAAQHNEDLKRVIEGG